MPEHSQKGKRKSRGLEELKRNWQTITASFLILAGVALVVYGELSKDSEKYLDDGFSVSNDTAKAMLYAGLGVGGVGLVWSFFLVFRWYKRRSAKKVESSA